MFKSIFQKIVGDPNKKVIDRLRPLVDAVAALEPELESLTQDALRQKTADLRAQVDDLQDEEALEAALVEILPEAYALVREASRRTTGLRHYDVQIMGGVLLNQGEIIEMRTGEGKTLVATLPLFLNALSGRGAHLVTVNEYLARRDGGWMGQIFHYLGMSVGVIGPQQYSALYDPEYVNPGAELEDDRLVHWRPATRREAYLADITYGISSEFGFDYLRDNMVHTPEQLVQRDPNFAIIDEADNVLIDEARTPLIISGPANEASEQYLRFASIVRNLRRNTAEEEEEPNGHYDIDEKSRSITLTDIGTAEIERRIPEIDFEAGESLYDPQHFQLTYYLDNALKAEYMFKRDKDYTVIDGEVLIIDDFTGRLMPGRRYSDGLHEAIEAKEGVQIKRESITVATITIQNYFRLYRKLAGMTGTAMTDAEEFQEIYEVEVTPLPTNVEFMAEHAGRSLLQARREKVDGVERITYYAPNEETPKFFKRVDYPDQVFANEEAKDRAIIEEVKRVSTEGRPVLVGTTSVEHSEKIHRMLSKENIRHNVLNAKMHQSEALVVAQAGRSGAVTISTNMAGRGTDILLGGNPDGLAAELVESSLFDRQQLVQLAQLLLSEGADKARQQAAGSRKLAPALVDRLLEVKEKFDAAAAEIGEIQIVGYLARSMQESSGLTYEQALDMVRLVQRGARDEARTYLKDLGMDTILADEAAHQIDLHGRYQIATKDERRMAEFLAEQLFEQHYNARAALIRAVLGQDLDTARQLCRRIPALPESLIDEILNLIATTQRERKEVWQLGGLHVVGSERHESRRIDNQLRGRAARQGDPGSSRFFLSLEDDLMRRFGGERLRNFMNKNIPDDMPIESGVLDRIIASSQERIEGYNFDIRKNVLEYDDVMAKQREAIYSERRKVLTGEIVLDERISDAFDVIIEELVDNYLDSYIPFLHNEINRVILDYSNQETGEVFVQGVLRRLSGLLPVHRLTAEEVEDIDADGLEKLLMELAYAYESEGRNILQLLQAMNRFIPLIPPVPNLAALLVQRKTGHAQLRTAVQKSYEEQILQVFNDFLANYIGETEKNQIWSAASREMEGAFNRFPIERFTQDLLREAQERLQRDVARSLTDLLTRSLAELDADAFVEALRQYIDQGRENWKKQIGEAEFNEFQRTLVLSAIDREWRDYLTAADDLRREIGLESAGRQRDPKIEYKKRSYEMFADMRNNIQKNIAADFFRLVARHDEYLRIQRAEIAYKEQLESAGYQVEQRDGKTAGLRRDMPKVGRNDPCPCGSGKKYKHCHMKTDQKRETAVSDGVVRSRSRKPKRRR